LQAQVAAVAIPGLPHTTSQDHTYVENAAKCACPKNDETCNQSEDGDDNMRVIGTLDCSSQLRGNVKPGNDCPDNLSKGQYFNVYQDGSGGCVHFTSNGSQGIMAQHALASFVDDTQTYCLDKDPNDPNDSKPAAYVPGHRVSKVRGSTHSKKRRKKEVKRRKDYGPKQECPFKQTIVRKGLVMKSVFGHLQQAGLQYGWIALKRMVCMEGAVKSVAGGLCHVYKTATCIKCPTGTTTWTHTNNAVAYSDMQKYTQDNSNFMSNCFVHAWKSGTAGTKDAELKESYQCENTGYLADAFQIAVKAF